MNVQCHQLAVGPPVRSHCIKHVSEDESTPRSIYLSLSYCAINLHMRSTRGEGGGGRERLREKETASGCVQKTILTKRLNKRQIPQPTERAGQPLASSPDSFTVRRGQRSFTRGSSAPQNASLDLVLVQCKCNQLEDLVAPVTRSL